MKHRKIFGKAVIVFMAAVMCLSSLMAVPVSAEATPTYEATEGWGAASDGIYYISSPQDLLAFAKAAGTGSTSTNTFSGKTVKLTKDIDLNPGWTATKGASAPTNVWAPINTFAGTFDGQGHSISGIYASGEQNLAFIWKCSGATIKNTRILNSYYATSISDKSAYVGAFVASVTHSKKATFENLYTDAIFETLTMPTTNSNVNFGIGGIAGIHYGATDGTYTNCVFAGEIYTNFKGIGGILGTTSDNGADLVFNNCVSYGTINLGYSKNNAVHCGIVASVEGSAELNNCIVYTISPTGTSSYSGAVIYGDNNATATATPAITLNDTYFLASGNANYKGMSAHASRNKFVFTVSYDGVTTFSQTGGTSNTIITSLRNSLKSFTSSDELRSKAAFASFEQINVGGKDYLIPESVANMQFGESHVAYAGYQLSTPADKLVNLRMVATTDTEPSKVGFEFTVTKGGKSGSDKVEATTVYTSILANYGTQEITAAELEGDYIYALVLGGISAEGDVTVSFRAYELAADGSVRYTAMRTVELTNGDDNVSN